MITATLSALALTLSPQDTAQEAPAGAALVEAYFDTRHEARKGDTRKLLKALREVGINGPADLEALLRTPRQDLPPADKLVGRTTTHGIECEHVDYATEFFLHVPENIDLSAPVSLVFVGHGGNSSMSAERAKRVARQYIDAYAPGLTRTMNACIVAPASERGWGPIGYSLMFSTISKVRRMLPVDPDRIYCTGQSMGGHLTYRAALLFGDAFGAVSPHSGGYDFAEKGSIGHLINVPGRSIFGSEEPYGINGDNKKNEAWGAEHGLEWSFVEMNGGHTIYTQALPDLGTFFNEHPRDLYRDTVYLRRGGNMLFEKTWQIKGWPEHDVRSEERPLRWDHAHWLELVPRKGHKDPQEVLARYAGDNRFEVHSDGARELRIYLHPKMVDFDKPVIVEVNGKRRFAKKVEPDPELMLETARRFDDRGRVFWAMVEARTKSDTSVDLKELLSKER